MPVGAHRRPSSGGVDLEPSRRRRIAIVLAVWTLIRLIVLFADGIADAAVTPRSPLAPCRVDLDRAGLAELMLLPGIGPERAEQIVLERVRNGPFGGADGLRRVPGIGPLTIGQLRPFCAEVGAR